MAQTTMYMISQRKLLELLEADLKLTALERGGVDNWEWYYDSLSDFLAECKEDSDLAGFIKDMEDEGNVGYGDDFDYPQLAEWDLGGYAKYKA